MRSPVLRAQRCASIALITAVVILATGAWVREAAPARAIVGVAAKDHPNESSGHVRIASLQGPEDYLSLHQEKITGVCGPRYESQFVVNRHDSRSIRVKVKTVWKYQNETGSTERWYTARHGGRPRRVELGCTGYQNPTGADTIYQREFVEAHWP